MSDVLDTIPDVLEPTSDLVSRNLGFIRQILYRFNRPLHAFVDLRAELVGPYIKAVRRFPKGKGHVSSRILGMTCHIVPGGSQTMLDLGKRALEIALALNGAILRVLRQLIGFVSNVVERHLAIRPNVVPLRPDVLARLADVRTRCLYVFPYERLVRSTEALVRFGTRIIRCYRRIAAKAGAEGGAVAGEILLDGITDYQLTESGLALQATVKGTKYWKDSALN